jgi:pimeloyl-ACP methyl ester carboxylesterase
VTVENRLDRQIAATLYDHRMERLVLVHGSVSNGRRTWAAQRPLAARVVLEVLNRRGFPPHPPVAEVDFEDEADWVAERVRPGDHLVGHSYGGVIALLAAARVDALSSLTVVEPPALGIARGEPIVERFVTDSSAHWREAPREPESFLRGFLSLVGSTFDPPSPLPPELEQGARTLMVERAPWEAEIPLAALRARDVPALVVSGGHLELFEVVCDALARELGAERAVCSGAGHVAQAAPGFNALLEDFVGRASAPPAAARATRPRGGAAGGSPA